MNTTYSSLHVLCVGNALIDAFLGIHDADIHCRYDEKTCELCFRHGDKILLDSCQFLVGGNAANVSVGLSRLGLHSGIMAELATDEFATKIVNTLRREGVQLSHILQTHGSQSSFAIGLNFKGERTLFVEHVTRKHAFNLSSLHATWFYLTSLGNEWKDAYTRVLSFSKDNHVKIAYNPGSHQMQEGYEGNKQVLEQTEILFVNKEEGEKLAHGVGHVARGLEEEEHISKLLQTLHTMGPRIVVMTDGKNGSYVLDEKGTQHRGGIAPGEPKERTGAGDAFASGFLAAHVYGKSIEEALKWGAHNSAAVIQKVGAQAGLLSKEVIESKINK